jgi:hypothetical protein
MNFKNLALIAVAALLCICIPNRLVQAKSEVPAFPKALLGVWETGLTPCRFPGNPDSDTRIEIKPTVLQAYEHSSNPLIVIQISRKPLAWKVKSAINIDGIVSNQYEIFSLSGKDVLTIVDENLPRIYSRCK